MLIVSDRKNKFHIIQISFTKHLTYCGTNLLKDKKVNTLKSSYPRTVCTQCAEIWDDYVGIKNIATIKIYRALQYRLVSRFFFMKSPDDIYSKQTSCKRIAYSKSYFMKFIKNLNDRNKN